MNIQEAIQRMFEHAHLGAEDMTDVMRQIMSGNATPAQIAGFLVGLRMKGETVEEITAAAQVMRSLATPVRVDVDYLVDTCGTGGDASNTFNISTASAFVAAAAGAHVAKHGNRGVSSKSGSADVLEAAGANLNLTPDQVAQCVREVGVGFLFAPNHHSAMKHAIGPRRELGVRTIFNLLGPLTNPASAPNQVLGVFSERLLGPMIQVLQALGARRALVVHAEDGLDEISISGKTHARLLDAGAITELTIVPEDHGFAAAPLDTIRVADAAASLAMMRRALGGEPGPARDVLALNGGAAIYVAGLAPTLAEGIRTAEAQLVGGRALSCFDAFIAKTRSFAAA
ncbi:MAG: anthranilate phosphoribosyltransferase [Thiotrichales bacterium]